MEHPPRATFLQCVERSEEMARGGEGGGTWGDTLIASMTAVYDVLSPQLRETLEGMTAHHGVHDLMAAYGTGSLVWTTRHYALALRTTARPARRSVGVEACSAYHTSSPLLCLSGGLLCAMLLQPLL